MVYLTFFGVISGIILIVFKSLNSSVGKFIVCHVPNTCGCCNCEESLANVVESLEESVTHVRKTISENTVGRIGPVVFLPLAVLGFVGHIVIFVIGATNTSTCSGISLLSVYMALLGCTGIMKCIGLSIQLGIAVQLSMRELPQKRKIIAAGVLSESSTFDNWMNCVYSVIVFIGAGTVFPSVGIDSDSCNPVMFLAAFYTTVIMIISIGIWIVWIFFHFVFSSCRTSKTTDISDNIHV